VAPLPAAARVLAACREGFCSDREGPMRMALADVALAHSGLAPATISLLYNVGARTLGDAFALPRPELGRRIGAEQMAALDRLRGAERAILPLYRPPDRFEHRIEFDHRIDAWPPLLFPLRRLCGELTLFLAARDGGVQRCALALDHEDRATTRVAIELLTPQRDAQVLYELVRSRLERVVLAAPVSAIALIAEDLPEFRPRHQDLFEPQRGQALEWPQLAERLRAHLGDEAVRRLEPAADHRPEKAWRFVGERDDTRGAAPRPAPAADKRRIAEKMLREARPPIAGAGSEGSASAAAIAGSAAASVTRFRPIWLLPHAVPLRGPTPRILAGPERIESGWWDGDDTRRDYYVVQTRDGQRAWAYLAAGSSDGWMLHGWFA
jgi:protein ImuB